MRDCGAAGLKATGAGTCDGAAEVRVWRWVECVARHPGGIRRFHEALGEG
ncbi:putative hypothetical protein [Streptomyces sp. NBRC 110611]|nr:putative hypothetical protein [Streptomyces sp. NBRC 110611]